MIQDIAKIVEMLLKGLTNAEEVDYIRAHPNYSAFRSENIKRMEDAGKILMTGLDALNH